MSSEEPIKIEKLVNNLRYNYKRKFKLSCLVRTVIINLLTRLGEVK